MTLTRSLKWTAGVCLALLVPLLVLIVMLDDWNGLREPIARRISSATGRSVAVNGDLSVQFSWRPRIVVNDVVFGNSAWSPDPAMAEITRLEFTIDLCNLLIGRVEFPEVALFEPHVLLEVSQGGAPNWVFGEQDKHNSIDFPTIGVLTIDHGSVTYRDRHNNTELALDIRTLEDGKEDPQLKLEVAGKGRFKGLPTTLYARGGGLLSLRRADNPYPIRANAILGSTRASIEGRLLDPLHLKGEELNFKLEGSDLTVNLFSRSSRSGE